MTVMPHSDVAERPFLPDDAGRDSTLYTPVLLAGSLLFLLTSCAGQGALAGLAILLWFASLAFLAFTNIGAAYGSYIAACAVYSTRHFSGWGSLFERPDNYAGGFLICAGLYAIVARDRLSHRLTTTACIISVFVVYFVVQATALGILSRDLVAWYGRMFAIPLTLMFVAEGIGFTPHEVRGFTTGVIAVGLYSSVVSLLEKAGRYDWIVPAWIADLDANFTIGTGRSGGLLMQSEFNGLLLGMVLAVLVIRARRLVYTVGPIYVALFGLTLAALYLTYTRAAWLAGGLSAVYWIFRDPDIVPNHPRRRALLVTFLVGAVVLASLPDNTARQRTYASETVFFRLNLWNAALHMIAQHPVAGIGFAQFGRYVGDYMQDSDLIPATPIGPEHPPPHNTFITTWVELGGVGLALYLTVLGTGFIRARRSASHAWGSLGRVWIDCFFLVYLINAQFVTCHEPVTNLIFFTAVGAVAAMRTGSCCADNSISE